MLTGSQNRRKSLLNNCPNFVGTVHIQIVYERRQDRQSTYTDEDEVDKLIAEEREKKEQLSRKRKSELLYRQAGRIIESVRGWN
jgi:hypothetical protein